MNFLQRRVNRRDERGAILVLATAGVVVALISTALAVDLGRLAATKRTNQKVADLAALDAILDFATMQPAAEASAARNGFVIDATHTVSAIEGNLTGGNCVPASGVGKVCVTVSSPLKNEFTTGTRTVIARALASKRNLAGFTIGSGVANVDSKKSILDPMLGDMVNGSVSIASYQGLANTTLSLTALQTELLNMGYAVGTPDALMNQELTAAEFYRATGNALVGGGDTANAAVFCRNGNAPTPISCSLTSLAIQATATGTISLRKLLNVGVGGESAAATSRINLFQILTGSAAVINGTNLVSVPSVNLNISGVTNSTGSLTLIEKPRGYFGPTGFVTDPPHVTTGQADLTVATTLNALPVPLNVVTGTVSLRVTAGTADGWLTDVDCTSTPRSTTVHALAKAATVTPTINVTLAGVGLLTVTVSSSAPGGTGDLDFLYPSYPSPSNPAQQSVGTPSMGLTVNAVTTGSALLDTVNSVVLAALKPVLQSVVTALDTQVIQPTLDALGISMGTADVKGLDPIVCGSPVLAG